MLTLPEIVKNRDRNFVSQSGKKRTGKHFFKNGVWDARTLRLLPFSPDFVFFKALDYDFDVAWLDPDADLSDDSKAAKSVIESILGPGDSTDYFLKLCGRKLATESADKCCFHMIVGETSCGKGVLEVFF